MHLLPAASGHFTSAPALQVASWEIIPGSSGDAPREMQEMKEILEVQEGPQLFLLPFLAPSTP